MTEILHTTPVEPADEPSLPEGRVTMRQVAEYVGAEVKEAKRSLRAEQKALKTELRWWLTSFAAVYQFHLNLTFFGAAFALFIGWTKLLPRLPFFNR